MKPVYKRLSSRKMGQILLHIVGNGQFWLENGQWPTTILNSCNNQAMHVSVMIQQKCNQIKGLEYDSLLNVALPV